MGSAKLPAIIGELNRIAAFEKKNTDWLLKVLHTTRALDSSLREVGP